VSPKVTFHPLDLQLECAQGTLLSEIAREAGIHVLSVCGSNGLCGRCRVRITSGAVSPLTTVERKLLSTDDIAEGYRLACQTTVLENSTVCLPATSLIAREKLHVSGVELEVPFDPPVEEYVISLPPVHRDDPQSEWDRLVEELERISGRRMKTIDPIALRHFPCLPREKGRKTRVCVRNDEVIDFQTPDKAPLGLAVDLGTTKIAAYLVDLLTGKTLALEGITNPQRVYGEDVMSRISHAMKDGATGLRQVVIEGLNELMSRLCPEPENIMEVTLVGNTAMHHLLLELSVKQLGLAPYIPAVKTSLDVKARDLGLSISPGGYVHTLPNVAGFIGSDHVAMILATRIHETDKTVVGVDIGTNTEIVLRHSGKMKSTSCASGPAFEGGHVTHGMGVGSGAIESVKMKDAAVEMQIINGVPPIGICGSGMLDTVAELCRTGLINRQGLLESGPAVRQVGTTREFVLVPGERSGTDKDITITQKDIHEIQLAKAAIRTGIDTLLDEMGITWEAVEEIIISGGFGASINPASAIAIGMFPPFMREQFTLAENAAGAGCKLCLISKSERAKAEEIAGHISYLELMTHPGFNTQFARAMYFPADLASTQEM
jgi:uncharacterized 2Fe-2S/4Fe-4S cluster protein (DUF4445 family)